MDQTKKSNNRSGKFEKVSALWSKAMTSKAKWESKVDLYIYRTITTNN